MAADQWYKINCPACGRIMLRTAEPFSGVSLGYCRSTECKVYREMRHVGGELVEQRSHKSVPVTITATVTLVHMSSASA